MDVKRLGFFYRSGSRLTWLRTVPLDAAGVAALATAGMKIDDVGGSIIGKHGRAGENVILLPNVPASRGSRGSLVDYVVLCHAWENRLYKSAPSDALKYEDIVPYSRRCTLADPYASGIIAKIMSVMSSPGTPDLPKGEVTRLRAIVTASAGAAAATGGTAATPGGAAIATVPPAATGHAGPQARLPAGTATAESTQAATGGATNARPQAEVAAAPATQRALPTTPAAEVTAPAATGQPATPPAPQGPAPVGVTGTASASGTSEPPDEEDLEKKPL